MKYYYFMSYSCEKDGGNAYGNTTFSCSEKIRTPEQINAIQKRIQEVAKVTNVILLSINLLDNENEI